MWAVEVFEDGKWTVDSIWDKESEANTQAAYLAGAGKNVRVRRVPK